MDLDAALRTLRRDRRAGSACLARQALDLLALAAGQPAATLALPALVRRVSQLRPVLAAVGVQSRRWLEELCRGLEVEPESLLGGRPLPGRDPQLVKAAGERARHLLLEEMENATRTRRAAFTALTRPGMTLLTLSASSQVEDLLCHAPAGCRCVLAESLPGGEGRALATRLLADGLAATVILDSELARAAQEADLALLGADAVLQPAVLRRLQSGSVAPREGAFSPSSLWGVNKLGSRLLLLAAKAAGLPVLLALGREKCCGDPSDPFIRGSAWDRRAFETFPLSGLSHLLGDPGRVDPAWLARAAAEDRRRWHLFMN